MLNFKNITNNMHLDNGESFAYNNAIVEGYIAVLVSRGVAIEDITHELLAEVIDEEGEAIALKLEAAKAELEQIFADAVISISNLPLETLADVWEAKKFFREAMTADGKAEGYFDYVEPLLTARGLEFTRHLTLVN